MAWLNKNGKQYYYRSKRVGKRVLSQYTGTGPGAEIMAQLDDHNRQQAEQQRKAWQAIKDEEKRLDAIVDDFGRLANAYAEALLLVNNYHLHKGQWRKKRASKTTSRR